MRNEKDTQAICEALDREYGKSVQKFLHYEKPWQLLAAVILSAQCTDARVNLVSKELFARYHSVQELAEADLSELEEIIHSVGFFHMKAVHLIGCAKRLVTVYGGEVPRELDSLLTLPGVGRKTANVIRGNIFNDPSIVVDTHVGRTARRLGFSESKDPERVEHDLEAQLPKEVWIRWNTHLITLGRTLCRSQKPLCRACFLKELCPSAKE